MRTEHPLARHLCARTGQPHIARTDVSPTTRTRVAPGPTRLKDCALWCLLKDPVIPASCLTCCRTCHRTPLHDLSPTSPSFRPSPSLSCAPELDQEPRDSRRSGGPTDPASPTGYEPKVVQTDDFEPRRIELDRNLETDPYQIPERILGDHCQNPVTEDTEETGKVGVDMRLRFS